MLENISHSIIAVYDSVTRKPQESFTQADSGKKYWLFRERYDRKYRFLGEEFVDEFEGWQMAGFVRAKDQLRINPTQDLRAITGSWKYFFDGIDRIMGMDK